MSYTNHLLTTKTFFGLKGNLKNVFIVLALSILICCGTVSYQQIATDSPYDLISLEDSLINDGLSKKNQIASEVFSKIVEMGVPTERVSITSSSSNSAQAEEVHIYLKN